jgi:hypothetical protein
MNPGVRILPVLLRLALISNSRRFQSLRSMVLITAEKVGQDLPATNAIDERYCRLIIYLLVLIYNIGTKQTKYHVDEIHYLRIISHFPS